jgi:cytochrome P450
MRAPIEDPAQRQLLVDDPSLIPGTVEEALRMFPAFVHFRRTATRDTVLNGQEIKLRILLEETLARYPNMTLAGKPTFIESGFLNQLKTLPVRLS